MGNTDDDLGGSRTPHDERAGPGIVQYILYENNIDSYYGKYKIGGIMYIDTNTLVEDLISKGLDLERYEKIMNTVMHVDVSLDEEFQKTFNYFYKVRCNKTWHHTFYELFEECKSKSDLRFEEIITTLFRKTGRVDASFSSKMLATINSDMPIWDQYVLHNLGLRLQGNTQNEKLVNAITIYDAIDEWYKEFLATDNAQKSIALFNSVMPRFENLSDIKKIDFLIWSKGSKS